ncbi:PulJ/GspJ family protein [Actinoplanes philippinensis]|uniref:PulJ/GspJ family protein n=1 Tax=Actinoplanes philippinensis TaxID=35752 RepID=UPI003400CAED
MAATRRATGMWQRLRTRLADGDDSGFTLAEMVIAMTILSFVTLITVTAVTEIYSGTKRIDNTAQVRDQLDNSFRRLDREIRYASWISDPDIPVSGSGAYYIEFATQAGCRQLKLSTAGDLSLKTWTPGSTARDAPMALASNIKVITGTKPFTRNIANAVPSAGTGMGAGYQPVFQQFRMYFNVQAGTVTLPFDATFTAQNTDAETHKRTNDCGGEPRP